MIIKEFKGFEDVYPETIKGTKEWFCGQCTPCSEANEVRDYNGNYVGTRLYLFHENGRIVEPIKQGKNVFLERPVYDCRNQTFGFLRFEIVKQNCNADTDILTITKSLLKWCQISIR